MPDVQLRITGRPSGGVEAVLGRSLVAADLAALNAPRPSAQPTTIKKLRDSHHALARALAGGMSCGEASIATGYTPSRISVLSSDPTFKELVSFYQKNEELALADLHSRMSDVALDAVVEIRDRLDEAPESFSNDELRRVAETFADRTGHAPVSRSVTAHIHADISSRLETARRRSGLLPASEDSAPAEPERAVA